MDRPLRWGILGTGNIARQFSAGVRESRRGKLAAVGSRGEATARGFAAAHEIPEAHGTYEALLKDPQVDAVYNSLPNSLHHEWTIRALEAGKHVLSEIPMATTVDEVRRIVTLTDATGLKYQMGNQVRYAHCLQDVQRMIGRGELGEVFYGEGEYLHNLDEHIWRREPDHWRVTGPVPQTTLLGGGPHALNTLRWLMGVEFVKASAFHAAQETQWGTTHTTVAIFQAANGSAAKVTTSYGMARPYCLYYSVYGSEGTFERQRDQGDGGMTTNYLFHNKLAGASRLIPVTLSNFTNPSLAHRASTVGHGTMEYEQARDVLRAIIDDTEPPIGPREAAKSVLPLICAMESADAGGGMVEVPVV